MPELCEANIQCGIVEQYERHRFLERLLTPPRRYTWRSDDRSIKVRYVTDPTPPWQAVNVPKHGSLIRFHLDAHLRTREAIRRSNTSYTDNLDWIEYKSKQMGLKLRGVDYDPMLVPINYPRRPFVKYGSRFRGISTIIDPDKFLEAISFGIGNGKAFGFGFLDFRVLEG